jgi:hypothetical protein
VAPRRQRAILVMKNHRDLIGLALRALDVGAQHIVLPLQIRHFVHVAARFGHGRRAKPFDDLR